jgi:hypothetical protein
VDGPHGNLEEEEETMRSWTRHTFGRRIVLALAVGALIAPAAQARIPDPDDDGVGGQYGPPDAWQVNILADHPRTRDASTPQSGVAAQLGSTIPAGGRSPAAPIAAGDGFDYGDAAVGFGAAAGIGLLGVGAGITIHRRSERRLPRAGA